MNALFLIDPISTLNPYKDSSYMMMLAASRLGDRVWITYKNEIEITPEGALIGVQDVQVSEDKQSPWVVGEKQWIPASKFELVFIRTDPPFDQGYLTDTWLMSLLPKSCFVLNSPHGLRTVNEKLWTTQFTPWTPKTLVSKEKSHIKAFLAAQHKLVGKPLNGFGGAGVFILEENSLNINVIIEALTSNGTELAIFQEYLPEAEFGDKRILLLNGEPLGAILRVHSKEDHRNNFFAGGTAKATEITATEMNIIEDLNPHLKALGLYFVGIDIIGGRLIEVNVTSPTCIQEINQANQVEIENQIYAFAKAEYERKTHEA